MKFFQRKFFFDEITCQSLTWAVIFDRFFGPGEKKKLVAGTDLIGISFHGIGGNLELRSESGIMKTCSDAFFWSRDLGFGLKMLFSARRSVSRIIIN